MIDITDSSFNSMVVLPNLLVVITCLQAVQGLSCAQCDKKACNELLNCKAGMVKGLCGCCNLCTKLVNERCGGLWHMHGKCAHGLKCVTKAQLNDRDRFLPENFKIGLCEPGKNTWPKIEVIKACSILHYGLCMTCVRQASCLKYYL